MAYNGIMIFIETSIFTKEIQSLISDDDYRMLQTALMLRPDSGKLIRGSGGSWTPPDMIFMLFPYKKTEQEDLTPDQLELLRKLVKEFLS
jgi:hypothetical protein